jgi:tRNA-2-methylthio-N6-dimethylallyladenosine synthase
MNVADIATLAAQLDARGGQAVADPAQADLVLVNTCTVRQKAEDKALSFFGGLKVLKQGRPKDAGPLIVAMGCVIPKRKADILRQFPFVDVLLDYSDPELVLSELARCFPPLAAMPALETPPPGPSLGISRTSFITAIRGCNHRCSYCVVPSARGPQRDAPLSEIVSQAQALEATGAPDVTVLGQNILAYGRTSGPGAPGFCELMETLLARTGFRWLSFLTSLPADLTAEVCQRVLAQPRVAPLLHLPVQSGSDKVLNEMRRGYSVEHYQQVVALARQARPDLYLTTDLLVGFPTETEQDFADTLSLVREVGFDDAFMFAYSPRPGTPASLELEDHLPRPAKLERLKQLIALQRELGAARNRRYLGQELEVIVEQRQPAAVVARTAFNKPVYLAASRQRVGGFTKVRVTAVKTSSFAGEEL